eukprot:4034323-Prorocentrum_lima.AAC.1
MGHRWRRDVALWELSTSVANDPRGPLLSAQLQETAKTYMQGGFEQALRRGDLRVVERYTLSTLSAPLACR